MIKKALIFCIKTLTLVLIAMVLVYLFKTCRNFGYRVFSDRAKDVAGTSSVVEAVIHIDEGESLMEIGEELEYLSIIRDKRIFALSVRFMDDYDKIGPGDYPVNSAMKPSEILKALIPREEAEQ